MKKPTTLIRSIRYLFKILYRRITPKGKEEQLYEDAFENIKANDFARQFLKMEIDKFLNNNRGIRMLPPEAKEQLVMNKFGRQLKEQNLKLDPFTKKLIHA